MEELLPVNTLRDEAEFNILRAQAPLNRLRTEVPPNTLRRTRVIVTGPAQGVVTEEGTHGIHVPYLDREGNEVGGYSAIPVSREIMERMPKSKRRR